MGEFVSAYCCMPPARKVGFVHFFSQATLNTPKTFKLNTFRARQEVLIMSRFYSYAVELVNFLMGSWECFMLGYYNEGGN